MMEKQFNFGHQPNQRKLEKLDQLISLLDHNLQFLKRQQHKPDVYKKLDSFKSFEKILHRFKKTQSYLALVFSHWDLIILAMLSLIFASYLAYFIASYFSSASSTSDLNLTNLSNQLKTELALVYKWSISKWMKFNDFDDYSREECAIVLPDIFNSVLRPKDNCGMCAHLSEIKRVKNINKEEFLLKYAYTGVPVIITDAIKNWSALKVFNFEFFRNLYLNDVNVKNSISNTANNKNKNNLRYSCQFFPYKTKFKSLVDALDMEPRRVNTSMWYIGWSNCHNEASKVLRKHYTRPYFLPDEAEMSRLDWIFMGTPGYGADIHIDDVTNPSWQAQISGVKRWTFKPVAECLWRCPLTLYATVYPGDIIVFDSNRWFHATYIVGNDLSLTIGSEYD